jgi:hypothetical protein
MRGSIADFCGSSQEPAALRDFGPTNVARRELLAAVGAAAAAPLRSSASKCGASVRS